MACMHISVYEVCTCLRYVHVCVSGVCADIWLWSVHGYEHETVSMECIVCVTSLWCVCVCRSVSMGRVHVTVRSGQVRSGQSV